jgi:hypothetical protein
MAFVLRCLATEDVKNPISKRCQNNPDAPNGILCKKHTNLAKQKPIYILMHHQVSKVFKIPFKNQVFVKIDLRQHINEEKPESKTIIDEKVRDIKNLLLQDIQSFDVELLKTFHNLLGMNSWEKIKEGKNEYAFRYFMSKAIIDALELASKV